MSIVFLYSSFPKWSETFLRQDLALLLEENVPIHPISLFSGDCIGKPEWPVAEVLQPAENGLHTVASSPSHHAFLPIPKTLHAFFSRCKHRRLLDRLTQRLQDLHATHLHAEFADLPALLGAEAARRVGIPFSVGIHACDIHSSKFPTRTIFRDTAFVTACNQTAADALLKTAPWLQDRIFLLHHGIDLQAWTYGPQPHPSSILRMTFVGRFVPKKGLDRLITAMGLLKQQHVAVQSTFIGDGPMKEHLQVLAQSLHVADDIQWTGMLPSEDVRRLLRQSDVLCAPSVVAPNGDRDGIPNTVLEAMALGVPVIASLVGGLHEVVTHDTAWPVKEPTPDAIADAIRTFISHPDEQERRRKHARQLVNYQFDARKIAKIRANLFSKGNL